MQQFTIFIRGEKNSSRQEEERMKREASSEGRRLKGGNRIARGSALGTGEKSVAGSR